MAKGNYGVTSLGGSGGSGAGSSGNAGGGGNYSRIGNIFAKGGYLPDVLENGASGTGKNVEPISEIAKHDKTTESDIATSFRQSKNNVGKGHDPYKAPEPVMTLSEYREMNQEDFFQYFNKKTDESLSRMNSGEIKHPGTSDRAAQDIVFELGLNDKPTVVSSDEFDRITKHDENKVIYHAFADTTDEDGGGNPAFGNFTGKQAQENLMYGDRNVLSSGMSGVGIYFSPHVDEVTEYGEKAVIRATLAPKARVVSSTELVDYVRKAGYNNLADVMEYDYSNTVSLSDSLKVPSLYTAVALKLGYNVISHRLNDDTTYTVVIDRSALIIDSQIKDFSKIPFNEYSFTWNHKKAKPAK